MQANKLLPIGALALAFAIGPAEATPAPTTSPLGKSEASAMTQVQWGYRRYHHHRRGWGAAPWIGLGAGVADRLRELGFPARDVNVGEAPSSSERFMRLRDEIWFKGRERFENRNVSLPKGCERLIAELTAPTYTFSSAGKIIVESKADLKKRGVMSPKCERPSEPNSSAWVSTAILAALKHAASAAPRRTTRSAFRRSNRAYEGDTR